jgi:predicted TIM-barrel fold metal-dependent hydrolase
LPADGAAEAEWLASLSHPPDATVAHCKLDEPGSLERVAHLPRVCGVRHVVNYDAHEPHRCWPGLKWDHTIDDAWRAGLVEVGRLGLSFDLQCNPSQLLSLCRWAQNAAVPEIIVNHLGMAQLGGPDGLRALQTWREAIAAAARLPHTYLKVSMLTHVFAGGWKESKRRQVLEIVEEAIAQFGSARCMWGSNGPVDATAGLAPTQADALWDEILSGKSASDREWLLRRTCQKAYRLEE